MPAKSLRLPGLVQCRNPHCARRLNLSEYRIDFVRDWDTHYWSAPALAGVRVSCTCGHHTQHYDPADPPAELKT